MEISSVGEAKNAIYTLFGNLESDQRDGLQAVLERLRVWSLGVENDFPAVDPGEGAVNPKLKLGEKPSDVLQSMVEEVRVSKLSYSKY